MGIQQDILKATQLIYDLKNKYPQQPVEELVEIVRNSYPNLNKAIDRVAGQAKAGLKAAKKEAEVNAKKAAENIKELAKNKSKVAAKAAPKAKAGVGGKVIGGAGVGLEAINTINNMRDKNADWRSRVLDASALAGMAGATYLGSALGHPVAGATAGEIISAPARNMSQNIRDMNKGLKTSSVKTASNGENAYNEFVKNKEIEAGIRYPNLQQELGYEYAIGASGKKYHVLGDRAYDFTTGKPVVVSEMLDDITKRYQGTPNAGNKNEGQIKMSDPQDFPFKTNVPVQNNVSNLPQAPRIQDMNPNPPIYDYVNGATLPPVQMADGTVPVQPVMNNNIAGTSTGAAASAGPQQFQYQPYTPTGNYEISPELLQKYVNAVGVNEQNQVSTPELKQLIQDRYQAIQQDLTQDPRYQGNMITSQGYYVDPKKYQQLAAMDRAGNAINQAYGLGDTSNLADQYANEQKRLYEIQIANQAGVPYEDYKAAMLDRQKQQILTRQKEITDLLTLQAQQTTDMKERLNLISEIYKVNQQAQQAIDVANANAFGDIQKQQLTNIGNANVANINRLGGIQKQQLANIGNADVANITTQGKIMEQRELFNDPTYQLKGASQFYSSMGYLPAQFQAGAIKNLSPAQQQAMFGTQFTPEQLSQMYGTQNLPANNAEQSNFNRFMAKIRGVQADEQ